MTDIKKDIITIPISGDKNIEITKNELDSFRHIKTPNGKITITPRENKITLKDKKSIREATGSNLSDLLSLISENDEIALIQLSYFASNLPLLGVSYDEFWNHVSNFDSKQVLLYSKANEELFNNFEKLLGL